MLLELTLRNSKRSKDLIQPHQSTASLIMHISHHINEDQRANFGSTCTIFECQFQYHIEDPVIIPQQASVPLCSYSNQFVFAVLSYSVCGEEAQIIDHFLPPKFLRAQKFCAIFTKPSFHGCVYCTIYITAKQSGCYNLVSSPDPTLSRGETVW